jgi:NADH-quinone oxidoreductase subunit N
MLAPGEQQVLMYGMLVMDRFACFFIVLLSLATAMTAMMSQRFQEEHGWESGEYYALLLLVAAGMGIMAMANDLVTVFLGIETMSLGVYVLVAIRPHSLRGTEAAMKYFLMGAVATAFLLYGIALIYGATGATNLQEIKLRLGEVNELGLLISGIFLMIVAMGFKVAAVPFHMWAPDAYEGAPTPVTGFMAAAVKAAAFAVVLRLFGDTFGGEIMAFGRMGWASPLVVLAAVTITVGNLAALRQENIKRMLAYSSISHAGILLVGVIAVGLGDAARAQPGVLYYLAAYTVTTLGAFAVVAWVGSRGRERVLIDDWAGLAAKHPGAALAMTIFMLSLGGIPPTGGFFGKFYVFKSAMEAHDQQLTWLVAVGVVNAAISIYYYLRVVMAMYFRPAVDEFQPLRSGAITVVLVICALAILEMGILPGFWLGVAGG